MHDMNIKKLMCMQLALGFVYILCILCAAMLLINAVIYGINHIPMTETRCNELAVIAQENEDLKPMIDSALEDGVLTFEEDQIIKREIVKSKVQK